MAKPQTRSETALQSAVMRFGDDAFRICYMHTKSGKETLTLLSDVFMQYFLDTQTFKSESEERLWVLRTAHKDLHGLLCTENSKKADGRADCTALKRHAV